MKILTPRNNKDYYDYLAGVYGIDDKVVYDRRQFTVLARLDSPFFSYAKMDNDAPKREIRTTEWTRRHCKWVTKYVATELHCMLEVGLKWYFFQVNRYLNESNELCLEWKIVKTKKIAKSQRLGETPITFFSAYANYTFWHTEKLDISVNKKKAIPNPILAGTPITSLIPPQEIYQELSSYISSLNDKEVIDTRNDVQKAEAAGFDRKTSFRNIK